MHIYNVYGFDPKTGWHLVYSGVGRSLAVSLCQQVKRYPEYTHASVMPVKSIG